MVTGVRDGRSKAKVAGPEVDVQENRFQAGESMSLHIISEKKLREFWTAYPESESPLRAWVTVVEKLDWQKFADVRATFGHADVVGRCVVFNIGGNKFRLIVAIHYNRGKVFVRHVLTHEEYDQGHWKNDCC